MQNKVIKANIDTKQKKSQTSMNWNNETHSVTVRPSNPREVGPSVKCMGRGVPTPNFQAWSASSKLWQVI